MGKNAYLQIGDGIASDRRWIGDSEIGDGRRQRRQQIGEIESEREYGGVGSEREYQR